MIYSDYDFKFAKTILREHHAACFQELEETIAALNTPLGRNVTPTPAKLLEEALRVRVWRSQAAVTPRSGRLRFDLLKGKVAVEIQLADPSDCYNDYLKFLLAYNLELIDVAVEVVYDDSVRGSNIPRLSKVVRDLELYRRILACPIWVIGLKQPI